MWLRRQAFCPALAVTLRRRISAFDVRVTVCVNTGIDLTTGNALDLIENVNRTGFIADLKEATMRLDVRIRKIEEKISTTKFEPLGASPPMKDFYPNTKLVNSLPFDTEDMVLSISTKPFAAGEVALAFPPVPFFKEFTDVVRYQHTAERKGKGRRKDRPAPNTPDTPVTLAYVNKADLDDEFVAEKRPIYFGLSPVTKNDAEGKEQAPGDDIDVGEKTDRTAALAAFDAFLRDTVRVRRGSRLTSRQIWSVWAARCGAEHDDAVVAGVAFTDVSRRFRTTFGATTAPTPARIDGIHQRYWRGFEI